MIASNCRASSAAHVSGSTATLQPERVGSDCTARDEIVTIGGSGTKRAFAAAIESLTRTDTQAHHQAERDANSFFESLKCDAVPGQRTPDHEDEASDALSKRALKRLRQEELANASTVSAAPISHGVGTSPSPVRFDLPGLLPLSHMDFRLCPGFSLLQKMGWTEGCALGIRQDGITEPILATGSGNIWFIQACRACLARLRPSHAPFKLSVESLSQLPKRTRLALVPATVNLEVACFAFPVGVLQACAYRDALCGAGDSAGNPGGLTTSLVTSASTSLGSVILLVQVGLLPLPVPA
jgi:hypothetical protein